MITITNVNILIINVKLWTYFKKKNVGLSDFLNNKKETMENRGKLLRIEKIPDILKAFDWKIKSRALMTDR